MSSSSVDLGGADVSEKRTDLGEFVEPVPERLRKEDDDGIWGRLFEA